MDNNKISKETQQKEQLHRSLWALAEQARGILQDDFKMYILGLLFYRFLSEDITKYFNNHEHESGNKDFNYENITDDLIDEEIKIHTLKTKGYFIYPSQLFINIAKNADRNDNLNIDLSNILKSIENSTKGYDSEGDFENIFDDVNLHSNKLGAEARDRNLLISKFLKGINSIDFGNFSDLDIDLFGDAYEFLISNYYVNAGKSGGEYFTPQNVSKLLAKLVMVGKDKVNAVYDPTCGSGGLLLQLRNEVRNKTIEEGFFGQEKALFNYNLSRMNMLLHNIGFNKFSIKWGDTLFNPLHDYAKPFDAIVSNPPYSIKWDPDSNPLIKNDERFTPAGVLAPKSNADFAFVLHCLNYLSNKGRAVILCFPGIFQRSGAEQKIRKYLIDNNFIDAIISLPKNLFYGTSIQVDLLIMAKDKTDEKVLFIDASEEYKKETNSNVLTDEHIENIVQLFANRKNIENISRYVDKEEIIENNYTLSVNTYVEKESVKEVINIDELNYEIAENVKKINELRELIDLVIKEIDNE